MPPSLMNEPEPDPMDRDHLPRLPVSAYRGRVFVHWSFSVHQRRRGWLSPSFHEQFRWVMLHGCFRYSVACPAYCLMPDHAHVLLAGWAEEADQQLFVRFLRRHLNPVLSQAGAEWQKQPYDHVLRKDERDPFGVESVAGYIAGNPVKARLVEHATQWPFTDCILPGYPEVRLHQEDFWPRYWRISGALR